jgi:hypothetical protein
MGREGAGAGERQLTLADMLRLIATRFVSTIGWRLPVVSIRRMDKWRTSAAASDFRSTDRRRRAFAASRNGRVGSSFPRSIYEKVRIRPLSQDGSLTLKSWPEKKSPGHFYHCKRSQ